ncbi:MAG: hypothetical protein JXB39_05605 [Deltaproteobacteria bacterium]|nr:hypothetical protein [Deltaproteobacteria bacterium]
MTAFHRLLAFVFLASLGCTHGEDDTAPWGDDTGEGFADADGDGWTIVDGDCDDHDPSVYPGATEGVCDGIDSDCDGHGDDAMALIGQDEYADLGTALAAAVDGDTVEICPGTWSVSGVVLDAAGLALTLRAFSGSALDTVLDGGGSGRILEIWGPADLTLQDLTFQNGYASWGSEVGEWGATGGAVFASSLLLTIEDCVFQDNEARDYGGAVMLETWDDTEGLVATGTTFAGNATQSDGAAIATGPSMASASPRPAEIRECVFTGNQGKAICLYDTGLAAADSTFSQNVGLEIGPEGGEVLDVYIHDTPAEVACDGCLFLENENAFTSAVSVYVSGTSATVRFSSSTFEANTSQYSAGVLEVHAYDATVDVILDGSTFEENACGHCPSVADLYVQDGTMDLSVTGCTFDGNTSIYGAALSMSLRKEGSVSLSMQDTTFEGQEGGSSPSVLDVLGGYLEGEIRDCTFEGNASVKGGTIRILETSLDSLTFADSTFRGNTVENWGSTALWINAPGFVVLDNVVVDGNTGAQGGAFWLMDENLTVTMNGGSVTSNTGTDTGGLRVDAGTFESVAVDWGTGETDNMPNDVLGCEENFGAAASFVATADGCVLVP